MHLLGGVLSCLFVGGLHRFEENRYADGRVHPTPDALVLPVVALFNAEHGWIESGVDLGAVDYRLRLAVDFVTDGRFVPARRGDEEVERLSSGVARVLVHRVEEFSGLLGEQLVENQSADVEALLGLGFTRQYPIEAVGVLKEYPLGGRYQLRQLIQVGALLRHRLGGVKHGARLIDVGGAGVDLGSGFAVGEQEI